jgi:hypothetical protein
MPLSTPGRKIKKKVNAVPGRVARWFILKQKIPIWVN